MGILILLGIIELEMFDKVAVNIIGITGIMSRNK